MSPRSYALALSLSAALLLTACNRADEGKSPEQKSEPAAAVQPADTAALERYLQSLQGMLRAHRELIVLFADEAELNSNDRAIANRIGQRIFHENTAQGNELAESLAQLAASKNAGRFAVLDGLLTFIESGDGLFDADRLAFLETLRSLERTIGADGTLPAVKLHKRVVEDLAALDDIERAYEKELRSIFSRFGSRAIERKRERWDDYVASIKRLYARDGILKEYGAVLPYPARAEDRRGEERQLYGYNLPPKTIVLTFDDGPHGQYTDEISAILKQYDAPAVFFEVGKNLGSITDTGDVKLSKGAAVAKRLVEQGFVVGNHSYSHAELSKTSGDALKGEIVGTDQLLKAVDAQRSPLFRFPYGANNDEGLDLIKANQLLSVMWNIDSLDWADPVPESIVERVLRTVDEEKRGIILFHDIHERTVKALPKILERLSAEGYRFSGWDGQAFVPPPTPVEEEAKFAISSDYGDSWAVVIGIDEYVKWPKLHYAVRDAQALRDSLVQHYGFASDHVFVLRNEEATRNAILALFHDRFSSDAAQKEDRLFVFFAGHGATRRLSSGRDLGYIVPVDSDPEKVAADAIPMSEIQNIAESIIPKHVLFVMDACYSGLGLTRGGPTSFLRDNARRMGRQMLTAGGADQLVADGGPNGHSVFTWTLLQALAGKGDLNGDGLMTATELAAYLGPAVAEISQQTPAFGSLPGSQGGEFVLERRADVEFLNAGTEQLANEAIELNQKLAEVQPDPTEGPIRITGLDGKQRTLKLPKAVNSTARQLAQRANDKGLQLYREQQYDAAEAQFTEALKLRPDFALAANNLGFVYFKRSQYQTAARWYENAIELDPSRAVAYLNLADAVVMLNDKPRAKKAYETYLALAPNGRDAERAQQALQGL